MIDKPPENRWLFYSLTDRLICAIILTVGPFRASFLIAFAKKGVMFHGKEENKVQGLS